MQAVNQSVTFNITRVTFSSQNSERLFSLTFKLAVKFLNNRYARPSFNLESNKTESLC